jgi:hypothetical protein
MIPMELSFLTSRHEYAFTVGDRIIPLSDEPDTFTTKQDALRAAHDHNLEVNSWGMVRAA